MKRAYKYELKPTERQKTFFCKTFGCCRLVYNAMLNKKISAYKTDKTSISSVQLINSLIPLKEEKPFLKEVPSQSLQQAIRDLDSAYQRFFKEKKGFPKFHKKGQKQSFRIPATCRIDFDDWKVKLPKVGKVNLYKGHSRTIPSDARICSYTISKTTTNRYYISILCDMQDKPKTTMQNKSKSVGIDLGVKNFAILSDGQVFENQKHLKTNLKKLRVLQRTMARRYNPNKSKLEQSRNWYKVKMQVAKLHERIRFQREDHLQKLSTYLSRNYETICIEDLAVKNMVKNHRLAQAISDCGWGRFVELLAYKTSNLVKVDRFFASSQTCSCCRYKNPKVKDLKVRSWVCPQCGTKHDRDLNASENILREGLSLCGVNVSQQAMRIPEESYRL